MMCTATVMRTPSAVLCLLLAATLTLSTPVAVRGEVLKDATPTVVTVWYNATSGGFYATDGLASGKYAAIVNVSNTFNKTGWDVVTAVANDGFMHLPGEAEPSAERVLLAYKAVGFGEGYATYESMKASINNTFEGPEGLSALLSDAPQAQHWIEEHVRYMDAAKFESSAFYTQLRNMLALIDGMVAGYNARAPADERLDRMKLLMYNMQAEIGDIVRATSPAEVLDDMRQMMPRWFVDTHCSAFVKVVKDDIYFGHATWSSFNTMLRQYKTYAFGGRFVTMSSYPGLAHSVDDWYMTHKRLAVMETTNVIHNATLLRNHVGSSSVATFLRAMIANFIAVDAPSWVSNFSRESSGAYNNQWMVLNMGAVESEAMFKNMAPNTFWVLEQLPGTAPPLGITSKDMTSVLNTTGYWASYNRPYFPNVYNLSGTLKMQEEYGDFYSYKNYSRARIFERDQGSVVDIESMKRLMRYNNYTKDPFSLIPNCTGAVGMDDDGNVTNVCKPPYSAMLSIAARGDLNPPGNATEYGPLVRSVGHVNSGAIDAKIATWTGMVKNPESYTAHVVCGPTTDNQPPFQWVDGMFDPMPPTYGLLKLYNFSFVVMETPFFKSDVVDVVWWIISGIGIGATILLLSIVLYYNTECSVGVDEDELLPEEAEGLIDPQN
ncbi:lysosomal/endosomal membrane protein p67 [Trypanosoma brucei equiperdum]|uniref:Phospholipase B-like n=1 Tax=Trypanosoma brucei equiperdum TaxID=630700 RepID=A0A3L6LD64_9TRYP|nr:lysosomal/endosomal membrane protein p67 [Trypanosoma brucei equiperdum]